MNINKKVFISILCIILSLILLGSTCLEAVGLTKTALRTLSLADSKFLQPIETLISSSDELQSLGIDSDGLINLIRSFITTTKDGELTYKEINYIVDVLIDNEEYIEDVWDLAQALGILSDSILDLVDSNDDYDNDLYIFLSTFDMAKLFRYIKLINFIELLIPITAVIALIACIIWNKRSFAVPYMLIHLIVAGALIFACIKINNLGGDVRITFITWFMPLLSVIALIFMGNEMLFQAFKSVNVDNVKKMVQNQVESAGKLGTAAVTGISNIKKESYKWTCPSCGFKNPDENNFCGSCGEKRPEISDDAKRMIAELELQIDKLTTENEQLKAGNEAEIKKAISSYEEQNKTLIIKRDALIFEIEKLKEDMQKIEDKSTIICSDIDHEQNALTQQVNDLTNRIKQVELEKSEIEEINNKYKEDIARLKQELADTKSNNRKFCRYCGKTLE